jgi:hypothetical protein
MGSFIICPLHETLLGWSNQFKEHEMGGGGHRKCKKKKKMPTKLQSVNLKGRDHLLDLGVDRR